MTTPAVIFQCPSCQYVSPWPEPPYAEMDCPRCGVRMEAERFG